MQQREEDGRSMGGDMSEDSNNQVTAVNIYLSLLDKLSYFTRLTTKVSKILQGGSKSPF